MAEVPAVAWTWLLALGLPLLLVSCTAFTKASVVVAALRTGLGAEALIPYPVALVLALIATTVVMEPTFAAVVATVEQMGGIEVLRTGSVEVWLSAARPLYAFMVEHGSAEEVAFFSELQGLSPAHPRVVLAAFFVTELGEALEMAVLVLIPFVVVDLVLAQVVALLGPLQLSTSTLGLAIKLLLFLAVDGIDVLVGGLTEGYRP